MSKAHKVLRVKVGESLQDAGARAAAVMRAVADGKAVQPYFGVSFAQMGQMLAAFTRRKQLATFHMPHLLMDGRFSTSFHPKEPPALQ